MRGRSRSQNRAIGGGPPEGEAWSWMTIKMKGSVTFRALGIHARRILDRLECEHSAHGGRENGNLAATYLQLEAWGVTKDDVRKGLAELIVAGFIKQTHQGLRQAGGGEPSRYALTWLPTLIGTEKQHPATNDWREVINANSKKGVEGIASTKRWIKAELDEKCLYRRGSKKKPLN
jgi:hypothetical protein